MDQTLHQLGQLLLGAIPTAVLLLTLCGIYTVLVQRPLEAVLAERRRRTQGAIEQAKADISAAAERAAEYENRLREARMAIFKSLDSRRKQAVEARAAAVAQARQRAQQQIADAKAQLEKESAAARASLKTSSEKIAGQIIKTILASAGSATVVGGK